MIKTVQLGTPGRSSKRDGQTMHKLMIENSSLNDSLRLANEQDLSSANKMLYRAENFQTMQILTAAWPAVIIFGFIANTTNIVVFLKAGAKDNVTILLISLSLSDLAFLALITPFACGYIIEAHVSSYEWPLHKYLVMWLLYWPVYTAYDLSSFISVSLGVMRCACVAMPLKFKLVFTKSRTIKWVLFLVCLAVSLRLPVLTIFRVTSRTDSVTNVSSSYLATVNREYMSRINDILNRGFLIWFNYLTMISCVIVLSYKLFQASKIRENCAVTFQRSSGSAANKGAVQTMSVKDLQVVKSVVLVCSIFIMSQLSFVILSSARLLNQEIDEFKGLHFLFSIFGLLNNTCAYLNASINIFVYYNYNSRYRSVLPSILYGDKSKE